MVLAFVHFYAMWYLAGVVTRMITMNWPDSFVGSALVFAQ